MTNKTEFNVGDLVRVKATNEIGEIIRSNPDHTYPHTVETTPEEIEPFKDEELELVTRKEDRKVEETKEYSPPPEQTVAIVSFEGAIKREVKAIRAALACCDSVSDMCLTIKATGRVSGSDGIKLVFSLGEYSDKVEGDTMRETLSEYLRRHGWDQTHKPKSISFQDVPA